MARLDQMFVNAMCISRQKDLLGKDKLLRVLDAPDGKEAFRMLREAGFGDGDVEFGQYESLLASEDSDLAAFVKQFAPTEQALAFCLAPRDFANAECLVRSAKTSWKGVMGEGSVRLDVLQKGVDGEYNVLPDYLVDCVREAVSSFDMGTATGVSISTLFARALYAYLLRVCKGKLKPYVQWQIDVKNIAVALRSSTWQDVAAMAIEGGRVTKDDLKVLFGADRTAIERRFAFSRYAEVVDEALKAKEAGKPMVAFERIADSALLSSLYPRRYESEGIVPFLLYYAYKTNEIANVRIILAGKTAGVDKEIIKERLRLGYGG